MKITCQWHRSGHIVRAGLSVIEVLTSMLVAVIGVAGVLVLIPFASRQAELGLDIDAAGRLARNAVQNFEIEGHDRLVAGNPPWVDATGVQETVLATYAIDPLGDTVAGATQFPFTTTSGMPTLEILNLANYDGVNLTEFTTAEARRLCLTGDDLQFGDGVNDLAGPEQIFDVNAGVSVRRQSRGELSWMSIVTPVKGDYNSATIPTGNRGGKFREHILVYRNRSLDGSTTMPDAQVVDPTAGVLRPGGTIQINRSVDGLRKGDWVMMINTDSLVTPDPGFETQVGFFRVAGVGDPTVANGRVTLDGPEFVMTPNTFVLLLVDFDSRQERVGYVINVFERTLQMKQKSKWNE